METGEAGFPERLAKARREAGFKSPREAAQANGWNENTYKSRENGVRGMPDQDEVRRYARAFRVSFLWLLTGREDARLVDVPVVGYAGAGGEIGSDPLSGDEFIEADVPAGTAAVKIKGASLGAGFNGWYALYSERRAPFTEDMLRTLCVVGTDDGRTLVKWVQRGTEEGRLHLASGIGEVEENVGLQWAARVIDLRPA